MRFFETRFLEDADEFIARLDPKTIKKILYNIDLSEQTNDPRLLKSFKMIYGSSGQNMPNLKYGFLPFGIRLIQPKLW